MKLQIDFGGTHFRYRIDEGTIITKPSKEINLPSFLDAIISKHPDIKSIGISFAGQVKEGVILSSPNIHSTRFDVKRYIESKYPIRLEIQNDLKCAALAEQALWKSDHLAVFYIGTGFGSAFIESGKLILGSRNQSGEIGHIPYQKAPFRCNCGREDCLELYTSGSGIEKWCEHLNIEKAYHRLDRLQTLDSPVAKKIVENFYHGLAHAFHTALNLFDFDTLVLGGSVGQHEEIKHFLKEEFTQCSFHKTGLKIVLSTLEEGSLEGTKYL
ncbi:MAG: ROK family protein [Campylobacterales bacterium]|nr:ROK family protein [Campylobacterales bacterium]